MDTVAHTCLNRDIIHDVSENKALEYKQWCMLNLLPYSFRKKSEPYKKFMANTTLDDIFTF